MLPLVRKYKLKYLNAAYNTTFNPFAVSPVKHYRENKQIEAGIGYKATYYYYGQWLRCL